VALTALLEEEEKERCVEAGMDEFLSKPVDPDHLCDLLDRVAGGFAVSADAPKTSQSPRDTAPTLDREALLRRAEGDVALAADLARMFLEDYPRTMKELNDAVLPRDGDSVRRLLHRLSGSLETLGARTGADAARGLSDATRRNQADWESPLRALQGEMQRLEIALVRLTKEKALP
jgi:HPt (histidine-containing phosphotransfer) domain-containing protein